MKRCAAFGVLLAAVLLVCACGKPAAPAPGTPKGAPSPPAAKAAPPSVPQAVAVPTAADAQPMIELSTTHLDMGTIPNDKPSKGTVTIRNKGNAPLVLGQVNTSCGCTMGSYEEKDKVVAPGGEAPLTLVVTPAKIAGFESTKSLTVFSNDPKQRQVILEVKVKIEPEFIIEPPMLAFEKVQKGEIAKNQLVIRQAMDEPFKEQPFEVTGARLLGKPPGLTANLSLRPEAEWSTPGRREYVVDVELDTNEVPPGPYQAMLDLETSLSRVRRMVVSATADVIAPYRVSPRPASFGLVHPGKALAGTVTVAADQPILVSDVAITGKSLTATLAAGPDEKTALIRIAVSGDATGGAKREQLTFKIKSGETEYREQVQIIVVVAHPAPPPSTEPKPAGGDTGSAGSK